MKNYEFDDLNKEFTVRLYRPGDELEIVSLLQLTFGGWPHLDMKCSSLDHWRWKYGDNPAEPMCITVAISQNEIIGCQHSVQNRIKIGDEVFLCGIVSDLAVHPDFRRMRVHTRMTEVRTEFKKKTGISLTYFMSGNPIVINAYSKKRPQFPHSVQNLVRIRDISAHLKAIPEKNAWLMKLGFHVVNFRNDLRNAFRIPVSQSPGLSVYNVSRFDDRIVEFWKQVSTNYSFIVERSRDYLNWRYCDTRAGDFVVKTAEEDGRLLGYSVLKINKHLRDYPIGFIVDLLTLPDRLDAVEILVADAVKYFDKNDVNIVNYLVVKDHPNESVFKRHGFLDSRIKLRLFYNTKEVVEKMRTLNTLPASSIFFSWGDHDSLPVNIPT